MALVLLDDKLRVAWTNPAFLALFETTDDLRGRPLEDLWNARTDQPALWTLVERAVYEGRRFQQTITIAFGGRTIRTMRCTARRLHDVADGHPLTLVMFEPIDGSATSAAGG
jgi:PAS domain-containing protein